MGVDFFSVFQEVNLQTNDQRVSNIVKFSDAIGELKVEVWLCSLQLLKLFIDIYIFTAHIGFSSLILVISDACSHLRSDSFVPSQAEASIKDGKRILFRFDRAAFSFKFLPFKVPYPVPFRLLGDEANGWLDTTYLSQSGNLRISRGSKVIGT